jgi:hypothetical protein
LVMSSKALSRTAFLASLFFGFCTGSIGFAELLDFGDIGSLLMGFKVN